MVWTLRWSFDKPTYTPGEEAIVSFWAENKGNAYLYFSDFELEFDFGKYELEGVAGIVPPRSTTYLGVGRILIPRSVVGRKIFQVKHRIYEYFNNAWIDRGIINYGKTFFISIYQQPLYRVFVSRGVRVEDRAVGDPIVEMIKEWGFETVTVGVEVNVPDKEVSEAVRREIERSAAVIAIATPRHLDALKGFWRTLEWLYSETGIAYGLDKPMLILKDKRVTLGGLPSYLTSYGSVPVVEFDPFNLDELRVKLAAVMPSFREFIEKRRSKEYFETLATLVIGVFAVVGAVVILPGIFGALMGSLKR